MLNKEQKKHLLARAHSLKPVVLIGKNGFTNQVTNEIEVALTAHQLIKIRANKASTDEVKDFTQKILDKTQAFLVQRTGGTMVFYRPDEENPLIK